MKFVRFDSVGGASGDMVLGALVDLGVAPDAIQSALDGFPMEPIRIEARRETRHGLTGTAVRVHTRRVVRRRHADAHGPHGHGPRHSDGTRRHLEEIERLIGRAKLPGPVAERSRAVFRRLAEAEARVHNCPLEEIHFHEVGAADSIADIVGACWALHALGVDAVDVGALPVGGGTVRCAHGEYPLPAPAVVELLRGFPVRRVDEEKEMVTPTGAALLMEWKSVAAAPAEGRVVRAGLGFGHHELQGRPNALRAVLMESDEPAGAVEHCLVLECEMDDCSGEWIGALLPRLLEAGALDVFTVGVQMKKHRPGVLLSVLCRPEHREALLDLIFRQSTTFGVREHAVRRTVLARRWEAVPTPYGDIRVKIGEWKGGVVTRAPEMEDCIARATEHGVAPRVVFEAARASAGDAPAERA